MGLLYLENFFREENNTPHFNLYAEEYKELRNGDKLKLGTDSVAVVKVRILCREKYKSHVQFVD